MPSHYKSSLVLLCLDFLDDDGDSLLINSWGKSNLQTTSEVHDQVGRKKHIFVVSEGL